MVHQTPSSVAIIYKICKGTLKVKLWVPWWIENEIVLMFRYIFFNPGSLAPAIHYDVLSGLWLVESDHVTWILVSDWLRYGWYDVVCQCVLLVMMRWSGIDGIVLLDWKRNSHVVNLFYSWFIGTSYPLLGIHMMWCVMLVMMRWSGIDGIVLLMGHWAASQQPQHTEPLGPNNIKWSTNIRRGCYHSENLASASLCLREISLST